jgi:hypothetical protein
MQKDQQRAQEVFMPGQSALILDSPQSIPDEDDMEEEEDQEREVVTITEPVAYRPKIEEPQWEIISPPVSTSSSASVSAASSEAASIMTKRTTSSVSSGASSVQTQITRPSVEVEEDDAALKAAVEISIARQISISRQQRNLLRTTTTASATSTSPTPLPVMTMASGTMSSGSSARLMRSVSARGLNQRAAVSTTNTSNTMVPRVVETKQSMPLLVDLSRSQYRKSERIVVEAA